MVMILLTLKEPKGLQLRHLLSRKLSSSPKLGSNLSMVDSVLFPQKATVPMPSWCLFCRGQLGSVVAKRHLPPVFHPDFISYGGGSLQPCGDCSSELTLLQFGAGDGQAKLQGELSPAQPVAQQRRGKHPMQGVPTKQEAPTVTNLCAMRGHFLSLMLPLGQ